MALSDIQVKKAQPKDKTFKLIDGGGLYLQVTPAGGKWWRFKYRFDGKEKLISFGTYPDISLAEARGRRQEARNLVAKGIDPSADRKAAKQERAELKANSIEVIAREWHKYMVDKKEWSKEHEITIMNRLNQDIFPWIGSKPITEVTAKEIKAILDRIRSRGVIETARRALTIMGQVYRYAMSIDRANYDMSAGFRGLSAGN